MRLGSGRRAAGGVLVAVVFAAGACSSGSRSTGSPSTGSPSTARGCATDGATAVGTSATYRVVLNVGAPEEMFSAQEAVGKPKGHGEVMVQGAMSMAAGPDAQHYEAHICRKSDNQVILDAAPTITVTDTTAGTAAVPVPVASMQGVGAGPQDRHYGNNIVLPRGHAFSSTVSLRGEQVVLTFTRA